MARSVPLLFSLFLLLSISLVPSDAATSCSSYKFSNKKTFAKCTDLAHLGASLHWTYNSDGSLSIAYVAPPASPNGWVAWGINPKSEGMVGTQALIAFKDTTGSMVVKTSNISSYNGAVESPILYETSDLSSVFGSDGNIILFAIIKIGKSIESVNQVYQVGSSVSNGQPQKHAFTQDNLSSKSTLTLSGTSYSGNAPAYAPAPAPSDGKSLTGDAPGAPSSGGAASPAKPVNSARSIGGPGVTLSVFMVLLINCIVRI